MSLLYKSKDEQTISCEVVKHADGRIELQFYCDGGKLGVDESLADWTLTPERLFQILDEREDITDKET